MNRRALGGGLSILSLGACLLAGCQKAPLDICVAPISEKPEAAQSSDAESSIKGVSADRINKEVAAQLGAENCVVARAFEARRVVGDIQTIARAVVAQCKAAAGVYASSEVESAELGLGGSFKNDAQGRTEFRNQVRSDAMADVDLFAQANVLKFRVCATGVKSGAAATTEAHLP